MQLVTRPRFYLDVAEEVEYLAIKAGSETALHWRQCLEDTIASLLTHPHLGRQRPDLQPPGVRSWRIKKFRRWLILYAVRGDVLVLLRVRYGMMDLPSLELES